MHRTTNALPHAIGLCHIGDYDWAGRVSLTDSSGRGISITERDFRRVLPLLREEDTKDRRAGGPNGLLAGVARMIYTEFTLAHLTSMDAEFVELEVGGVPGRHVDMREEP